MSPRAQLLALLGPGNSIGLLGTSQSLLSWTYIVQASCNCFRLLRQTMPCALALARARAGRSSAARIAMMPMTTDSSIRVKPEANCLDGRMDWPPRAWPPTPVGADPAPGAQLR